MGWIKNESELEKSHTERSRRQHSLDLSFNAIRRLRRRHDAGAILIMAIDGVYFGSANSAIGLLGHRKGVKEIWYNLNVGTKFLDVSWTTERGSPELKGIEWDKSSSTSGDFLVKAMEKQITNR